MIYLVLMKKVRNKMFHFDVMNKIVVSIKSVVTTEAISLKIWNQTVLMMGFNVM